MLGPVVVFFFFWVDKVVVVACGACGPFFLVEDCAAGIGFFLPVLPVVTGSPLSSTGAFLFRGPSFSSSSREAMLVYVLGLISGRKWGYVVFFFEKCQCYVLHGLFTQSTYIF